jgi:hypothetical protein
MPYKVLPQKACSLKNYSATVQEVSYLLQVVSSFLSACFLDDGTSCAPDTVLAAIYQSRDQLCLQLPDLDSDLSTTTACVK